MTPFGKDRVCSWELPWEVIFRELGKSLKKKECAKQLGQNRATMRIGAAPANGTLATSFCHVVARSQTHCALFFFPHALSPDRSYFNKTCIIVVVIVEVVVEVVVVILLVIEVVVMLEERTCSPLRETQGFCIIEATPPLGKHMDSVW